MEIIITSNQKNTDLHNAEWGKRRWTGFDCFRDPPEHSSKNPSWESKKILSKNSDFLSPTSEAND